jgi:flagellar basal-body rod protein FlgC
MSSDANDFGRSMGIATSALRAQSGRMRVISENIANADSTATTPGGDPYRRRIPTFRSELDQSLGVKVVGLGPVATDESDFVTKFQPGHPAADASGIVKYPNVNTTMEMTDMQSAQRSYTANVNVITATRTMIQRTIDILRS